MMGWVDDDGILHEMHPKPGDELARLREENEQADRLVSEYRERQTEAERQRDEALALLRRIAALPDYGDMGGETEEWWDELQQICRAAKVMLAGELPA